MIDVGGRQIVFRDFILDSDRAGPIDAAEFALQMLLVTEAGGLDTRDDWDQWLRMAGFNPSPISLLPGMTGSSIIIAAKD